MRFKMGKFNAWKSDIIKQIQDEHNYGVALKFCIEARNAAIVNKPTSTRVGACLYSEYECYKGFNIQNRCHKSYHAEEMAVLAGYLDHLDFTTVLGITISYSNNNLEELTFACGHCRQVLWEATKNPNLLISEVDLRGNVIKELTLGELYPVPYPYFKMQM